VSLSREIRDVDWRGTHAADPASFWSLTPAIARPSVPFVFFFVFFVFFFNAKDTKIFTKVTNKDAEGAKCNA
jgi:hypothetical protein